MPPATQHQRLRGTGSTTDTRLKAWPVPEGDA